MSVHSFTLEDLKKKLLSTTNYELFEKTLREINGDAGCVCVCVLVAFDPANFSLFQSEAVFKTRSSSSCSGSTLSNPSTIFDLIVCEATHSGMVDFKTCVLRCLRSC